MTEGDRRGECLEKLVRRGIYSAVMGAGAFFAYANSVYGWITPPEYSRTKGAWLKPVLEPYLAEMVIGLGVGFFLYAAYCLFRYRVRSRSPG